jgi:hypothetical protein
LHEEEKEPALHEETLISSISLETELPHKLLHFVIDPDCKTFST